jgi:hypothetical protein
VNGCGDGGVAADGIGRGNRGANIGADTHERVELLPALGAGGDVGGDLGRFAVEVGAERLGVGMAIHSSV